MTEPPSKTDSADRDQGDPERPQAAMEMKEQVARHAYTVDSYGAGGFRIAGTWYTGAVLLTPEQVTALPGATAADLSPADLVPLWNAAEPSEIVLFGAGAEIAAVPQRIKEALAAQGLSADPMDTGAAARTFNVLAMEERRVGAILLPL